MRCEEDEDVMHLYELLLCGSAGLPAVSSDGVFVEVFFGDASGFGGDVVLHDGEDLLVGAEAIAVGAPVIKKYREIQTDLHHGSIFPIGDEPSGRSWTGFQSVQEGKGYFIVFREANDNRKYEMKTWLKPGTNVRCTAVIGKGKSFSAKVGNEGTVFFELPDKNCYALYEYVIK